MSVGSDIMDGMEDKIVFEVNRSLIENNYDITFTDEQWQTISDELLSALDHYTWLDLPRFIEDLD
jgi:hypothetical protein